MKKLIYIATIVLLLLLTDTNFVFCHKTNGGNHPKTSRSEESAKIIIIAMYVDPEHPEPGDEFTLGFKIKNNSTLTAEDLNATINLPIQLELVSGSNKVHLGSFEPNQEQIVFWSIRANSSGDCIIDLYLETSNLGNSQSRWLLEIFPKFTSIFLSPWFQLFAIIVLAALAALVVVFIRRHFHRSSQSRLNERSITIYNILSSDFNDLWRQTLRRFKQICIRPHKVTKPLASYL